MPGGGTCTFLEPDHYEASLRQAQIEAVIVGPGLMALTRTLRGPSSLATTPVMTSTALLLPA